MYASVSKHRILILGGGFAGVATARHLESLLRRRADVEIALVSAENFVLMTPLLFEVLSGTLDLRDCSAAGTGPFHAGRLCRGRKICSSIELTGACGRVWSAQGTPPSIAAATNWCWPWGRRPIGR